MSRVAFVILVLGFTGNLSVALRCYICGGSNCQTSFEGTDAECTSYTSPRCAVTRYEADGIVTIFHRRCIEASLCADGCEEGDISGVHTKACIDCCDTDLCNTGTLFTPFVLLLIGGTVTAVGISATMSK
ncbi:ly6/PLAUR domain-containing protein 2-like [Ptychodera flava]|uniref:ly6/PLAUR domain-containing protein 2-like n=1 Tax=Ptychodera flava TaxID=63121 RepID=UPI00396AB0A2